MKKNETLKFLKKVSGTYPNQFFITEEVQDVWIEKLEPYDLKDVEDKFEEHLRGSYADKPPLVHYLIKYLKTIEEKKIPDEKDYMVQCNMCNRWMPLSKYDEHYGKCLLVKSVMNKAKQQEKDVKYEELDKFDYNRLTKAYDKLFTNVNFKEMFK